MNESIKILMNFDDKYDVINHMTGGKFSSVDSEHTAEMFNAATRICDKDENVGIAQGIECFYYIFQMWKGFAYPHSAEDQARSDQALGMAKGDLEDFIDSALEKPRTKEINYSTVGNLNLEALRLSQGTIGSRGLMWELNDRIFSEEDAKKMNRLTEITRQLTEYNPEVAKALQSLNSIIEFCPRTEHDRVMFTTDFDRAFEWVNKINQYLVKLC